MFAVFYVTLLSVLSSLPSFLSETTVAIGPLPAATLLPPCQPPAPTPCSTVPKLLRQQAPKTLSFYATPPLSPPLKLTRSSPSKRLLFSTAAAVEGFQTTMEKTSKLVAPLTCPHCAGPLSKEMETSCWTVPPLIRDSFSMIGSAVGGTTSAFYAFNFVMPTVRKWVKGPMWLHFLVGAPPVIVFSSACAGLAGGAVPAFAQLASSSYHAAMLPSSRSSPDDKAHTSRTSSTL